MDISLQTRLLRVLETGQFMKIGSTTLKHVDVRVIAATNRDLEQEIVNGNTIKVNLENDELTFTIL